MEKMNNQFNIYAMLQKWMVLLVLVLSVVIFASLSPYFLKIRNIYAIGLTVSVIGIVSIGQTMCIMIRGFDLSVGGVSVFCGMIVAFFTSKLGVPYIGSICIGLAIGALIGFVNGILITKGKINPFITTLSIWFILDGAVFILSKGYAIIVSTKEFLFLGTHRVYGIPLPIIIMIVLYIIFELMLRNTIFGRKIYLTGGNPEAAKIAGLEVDKLTIKVYMLSSILAAFGGVILTSRMGAAQLTSGTSYPLGSIAAVVLGGTALTGGEGRLTGTVIGVLIIGVLTNGLIMLGINQSYRDITTGLVLLLAVLFQNMKYSSSKLAVN